MQKGRSRKSLINGFSKIMAPNQIKHIRLIGRIGLISLIVNIGFIGMALAPLPAQAQGCCACINRATSIDGKISLCFDASKGMTKEGCKEAADSWEAYWKTYTDIMFGINDFIKTQNGNQYFCFWEGNKACGEIIFKDGNQCPNTYAGALAAKLSESLNVKFDEREPLCFKPSVSIPGTDFLVGARDPECPGGGIKIDATLLAKYIAGIYYFIISSIGILAVVGIMIGGFQYLMAAGSPEKISSAKTSITSAIIGLIIALTSYLLFNTINPDIVNLRTSGLKSVNEINWETFQAGMQSEEGRQDLIDQKCEDTLAALINAREGGLDPIFQITASDTRMHEQTFFALNKMANSNFKVQMGMAGSFTFKQWVESIGAEFVTITSAYRLTEKQFQLKQCYDYRIAASKDETSPCPYNCSSCNYAAEPNCNSAHVSGFGLDICINTKENDKNNARCDFIKDTGGDPCLKGFPGCNGFRIPDAPDNQAILQQFMAAAGFGLLKCEWWHFDAPARVSWWGNKAASVYRKAGGGSETYIKCGSAAEKE